jgi:hypothetical protein
MLPFPLCLVIPFPDTRTVQVRDFARISPAGVETLDGRRVVLRLERDSQPEKVGKYVAFDCVGPNPADDLHRTCWLKAGEKVGTVLIVAGRLRVVQHGRSRDGQYPAFTELRLEGGHVLRVVEE